MSPGVLVSPPPSMVFNETTAKASGHRRIQRRLDETGRIVDLRVVKKKEIYKDGVNDTENGFREETSSSSEDSGDGRSNDDAQDSSETSEDQHYFDTNFEDSRSPSDIKGVADTIENFARSISGLSLLSDLGLEDISDREVDNIEDRVIQEFGIDYIKTFEKEMEDDDGTIEDKSWDDTADSSLNQNTTATTAEILDDIINTERVGREVEYDPIKKESSGFSLKRSLSFKGIPTTRSSSNRSSMKGHKLSEGKEIEIVKTDVALAQHNEIQNQNNDKGDLVRFTEKSEADDATTTSESPELVGRIAKTEFIQDTGDHGNSLDRTPIASSLVNRKPSSRNTIDRDLGRQRDDEQLKNIASNFEGSETGSQFEHQYLEVIHSNNGPLIRGPSIRRTNSLKSSSSLNSSACYDNKEVIYDPAVFGLSSRSKTSRSSSMVKKNNSCCDLREITTARRTRSLEDKHQLEKHYPKSIQSDSSVSLKPWKVFEHGELEQTSLSNEQKESYPTSEFEGVEMQLRLDCLNIAALKKSQNKKEHNGQTSRNSKRRILDPERLFCGLKPQQRRLEASNKKVSKLAKDTNSKHRKKKVLQKSSSGGCFDAVRKKEKVQNVSIDTAVTVPTEDEDALNQFKIEVTDISNISKKDPLIYALLENSSKIPNERDKKSYFGKGRRSGSREFNTKSKKREEESEFNVLDTTKISVTTVDQSSDSITLPRQILSPELNPPTEFPVHVVGLEDDPVDCQTSAPQGENSKYGGELVDLLHQISSYVDGIVENNNYSFPNPLAQYRGALGVNKDGNEADDEKSNGRSRATSGANSVVSAASEATPIEEQMLDAIYVPNNETPEKKAENKKLSAKDEENQRRKADLLSLFDNSPKRSQSKAKPHPETPERSLFDDDVSEDSSAINGSFVLRSVQSVEQQEEEFGERWEENPVIYHMKSSPPKPKRPYRTNQKRTNLKRPVERHPLRSKPVVKPPQRLVPKETSVDDNKNLSIESLPKSSVTNEKTKDLLQKRPLCREVLLASDLTQKIHSKMDSKNIQTRVASQKENRPSTSASQMELDSTVRGKPSSLRGKSRPLTSPTTFLGNQVINDDVERQNKTSSRNNGYVVDDDGFLLDRTAALLEDLDKSADLLEDLEKGSESAHNSIPNATPPKVTPLIVPVVENCPTTTGDRSRRPTRVQNASAFRNHYQNVADFERSFEAGTKTL